MRRISAAIAAALLAFTTPALSQRVTLTDQDISTLNTPAAEAPSEVPTPRKNWRIPALTSDGSATTVTLTLAEGKNHIVVPLPQRQHPVMITYRQPARAIPVNVSASGQWTGGTGFEALRQPRYLLDKVTVPAGPAGQVTLTFEARNAADEGKEVKVDQLAVYELRPEETEDYWLVIGASIQEQSIRQDRFNPMVQERFPGFDPVIFNLAVSGWRTEQLRRDLPSFLEDHPEAEYVLIHIGGNNVSAHRPYPGGVDRLREDLVAILEMIRAAGKTPVLSRLSYRAYKASNEKGAVPPEENGSGPYVENVYDPLIAQYCPAFVDPATGKGRVDAYGWFKAHPEELSTDGIHVKPEGAMSWNRLWVEGAGPVVYGQEAANP